VEFSNNDEKKFVFQEKDETLNEVTANIVT